APSSTDFRGESDGRADEDFGTLLAHSLREGKLASVPPTVSVPVTSMAVAIAIAIAIAVPIVVTGHPMARDPPITATPPNAGPPAARGLQMPAGGCDDWPSHSDLHREVARLYRRDDSQSQQQGEPEESCVASHGVHLLVRNHTSYESQDRCQPAAQPDHTDS